MLETLGKPVFPYAYEMGKRINDIYRLCCVMKVVRSAYDVEADAESVHKIRRDILVLSA